MNLAEKTRAFTIKPRGFEQIELKCEDSQGFYLFEIKVTQTRQIRDDISVYIMNHENFLIWRTHQQVGPSTTYVRHVQNTYALNEPKAITSVNMHWGILSFIPPSSGLYHLVLSNAHSTFKSKEVVITEYWHLTESRARYDVRQITKAKKWDEAWMLLEHAEKDLQDGRLAGCCDYLRKGLITIWQNVCEHLTSNRLIFEKGKSVDISQLQRMTEPYAPDYTLAAIRSAWSLLSELSHVEKRGSVDPPLNYVIFAHRFTYCSAAFLLSLIPSRQ